MIFLAPIFPAVAGTLIWIWGGRREATAAPPRAALAIASVGTLLVTIAIAARGAAVEATASWSWGGALRLQLADVELARVVAILVPVIAAPVIAYAVYHEEPHGLARLVGTLTAFVGAMELLVLADDLLSLLFGWELVGVLSWALIGFEWREPGNMSRAAEAFVPTRFGDLGLFLAAGAAFAATGSFAYADLARADGWLLDVVAAGVLVAAVAKSGQLPFSPWLFSAMAGPTPVSALLHSATMVAAGAYALARLEPALASAGWFGPTVLWIGLLTALSGGAVAVLQDHGKRILAASTSAQYGLMLVAIGAGYPGAAGAHLVTQAFFKALLFLGFGIAMQAVGTGDVRTMRLGARLPRVALVSGVGSLALAAVPPLGAAWSKDAIVAAASRSSPLLAALVLAAGVLSATYAARMHLLTFGRRPSDGRSDGRSEGRSEGRSDGRSDGRTIRGPSGVEVAASAALAVGSLALAVLWIPGAGEVVGRLTGGEMPPESLGLAALGLVGVGAGLLAGRTLALASTSLPATVRSRRYATAADWLGIPALTRVTVVDPVLALCRALARFDMRVVDGGVRAAAWLGSHASSLLSIQDRLAVDGAVEAIARAAVATSGLSRVADDRGVDGTVEGLASGVGTLGRLTRRAQTGLVHHYLAVIASGVVVLSVLALVWR